MTWPKSLSLKGTGHPKNHLLTLMLFQTCMSLYLLLNTKDDICEECWSPKSCWYPLTSILFTMTLLCTMTHWLPYYVLWPIDFHTMYYDYDPMTSILCMYYDFTMYYDYVLWPIDFHTMYYDFTMYYDPLTSILCTMTLLCTMYYDPLTSILCTMTHWLLYYGSQRLLSTVWKLIQVWNNMWVRKLWQNCYFWVTCPFKSYRQHDMAFSESSLECWQDFTHNRSLNYIKQIIILIPWWCTQIMLNETRKVYRLD